MSLRAIGECVEYTERPWSMDGRSGVSRKCKIQTSRSKIVELKMADDVIAPFDGQHVDLLVEPRMSEGEGRRSSLNLTVVGHYTEGSESSSGGRRAAASASSAA